MPDWDIDILDEATASVYIGDCAPSPYVRMAPIEFDDIDAVADCELTLLWCLRDVEGDGPEVEVSTTVLLKTMVGLKPLTLDDIGYSDELIDAIAKTYMREKGIPMLGIYEISNVDGVLASFAEEFMPMARIVE